MAKVLLSPAAMASLVVIGHGKLRQLGFNSRNKRSWTGGRRKLFSGGRSRHDQTSFALDRGPRGGTGSAVLQRLIARRKLHIINSPCKSPRQSERRPRSNSTIRVRSFNATVNENVLFNERRNGVLLPTIAGSPRKRFYREIFIELTIDGPQALNASLHGSPSPVRLGSDTSERLLS